MNTATSARAVRTKAAMLATLTTAALVLTACGGGSTAATPGASSGGAAAASGLAEAKAHVAEAETRPTQINITTPVSKPVPTGKKIMFISCGGSNCALESDIIKSAT